MKNERGSGSKYLNSHFRSLKEIQQAYEELLTVGSVNEELLSHVEKSLPTFADKVKFIAGLSLKPDDRAMKDGFFVVADDQWMSAFALGIRYHNHVTGIQDLPRVMLDVINENDITVAELMNALELEKAYHR